VYRDLLASLNILLSNVLPLGLYELSYQDPSPEPDSHPYSVETSTGLEDTDDTALRSTLMEELKKASWSQNGVRFSPHALERLYKQRATHYSEAKSRIKDAFDHSSALLEADITHMLQSLDAELTAALSKVPPRTVRDFEGILEIEKRRSHGERTPEQVALEQVLEPLVDAGIRVAKAATPPKSWLENHLKLAPIGG
jgi:hypothetical protein